MLILDLEPGSATTCENLSEFQNFSEPQFLHFENGEYYLLHRVVRTKCDACRVPGTMPDTYTK